MPSTYTATNAEAYEQLMGRWSGRLAEQLIDFAGLKAGDRVLDLGCGTGSLVLALAARPEPAAILGVDIARSFLDFARERCGDARVSFVEGDGCALSLDKASFDRTFSLLAINFMSAPREAIAGMRRVTKPGGAVAAAVWDFAGGLTYQRIFWDTAAALDEEAERARARQLSSPLTGPGQLAGAFREAGLREVASASLTIRMDYADFADYWEPIANAPGPVGDYMRKLSPDRVDRLAEAIRRAYLSGGEDGPRSMAATAWAARGLA